MKHLFFGIAAAALLAANSAFAGGGQLTLFTNTVSPAATVTNLAPVASQVLTIPQGGGMVVYLKATPTNNGTGSLIASFNFVSSVRAGSLSTTTLPLTMTNTLGGSNVTTVVSYSLTAAQLANYWGLRLDQVSTTQTNAVPFQIWYENAP
jgi:hypothetical protein